MKLRIAYIIYVVAMLGFSRVPSIFINKEFRLKLLSREGIDAVVDYGAASQEFALYSIPFFVFSILLGYWGRQYIPKVSFVFTFAGIGMIVWSGIMYTSPRHISPSEVSIVWYIYILINMILGVWAYRKVSKMPEVETHRSDILDDL